MSHLYDGTADIELCCINQIDHVYCLILLFLHCVVCQCAARAARCQRSVSRCCVTPRRGGRLTTQP